MAITEGSDPALTGKDFSLDQMIPPVGRKLAFKSNFSFDTDAHEWPGEHVSRQSATSR